MLKGTIEGVWTRAALGRYAEKRFVDGIESTFRACVGVALEGWLTRCSNGRDRIRRDDVDLGLLAVIAALVGGVSTLDVLAVWSVKVPDRSCPVRPVDGC